MEMFKIYLPHDKGSGIHVMDNALARAQLLGKRKTLFPEKLRIFQGDDSGGIPSVQYRADICITARIPGMLDIRRR